MSKPVAVKKTLSAGLFFADTRFSRSPRTHTHAMATNGAPSAAIVAHADRAPPLGVLLAAHVGGVPLDTKVDARLAKGAEPRLELEGG